MSSTLKAKIEALEKLEEHGGDIAAVSRQTGISPGRLRRWQREADSIRQAQRHARHEKAARIMSEVEQAMAEKSLELVEAIDSERITKAPLNQLAAALSVLVDRYLKLSGETTEATQQVIRFEYVYPDGHIGASPPWAGTHSEIESSLSGGGVRQALRQDRTGQTYTNGKGAARREADVVAGPDISDGESGLAGFEGDDAERLWYDD